MIFGRRWLGQVSIPWLFGLANDRPPAPRLALVGEYRKIRNVSQFNLGILPTCPYHPTSKKSIKRMVEKIHALTDRTGTWQETTKLVGKVNRTLRG
jgi:hypothetical protein